MLKSVKLYIPASIVPFLISGPFFPDLIVTMSSLFFLFYAIQKNLFFYFNNKPLFIFFIFCVYIVFNSLVSLDEISG